MPTTCRVAGGRLLAEWRERAFAADYAGAGGWDAGAGLVVEHMSREESVLLLLRRAGVLSAEATLDQASDAVRAAAESITEEMDGLPLALDQAGAYIEETQCSLSSYLQ